ncbi:hypothetical protein AYO38_01995 [bacterium SCGC AG-212-C10]|nr:hypothetical protein AYO38_01995 [bacterium SCGC AG-212-C10]
MTWGYTVRYGLQEEELKDAAFANALDQSLAMSGNYLLALSNGQSVTFSAAEFIDGGAVRLLDAALAGETNLPPFRYGMDVLIDHIVWIADISEA